MLFPPDPLLPSHPHWPYPREPPADLLACLLKVPRPSIWRNTASTFCSACTLLACLPADRATPINLAQHSYFNLAGHNAGGDGVLGHELIIHGDHYTPVGDRGVKQTSDL